MLNHTRQHASLLRNKKTRYPTHVRFVTKRIFSSENKQKGSRFALTRLNTNQWCGERKCTVHFVTFLPLIKYFFPFFKNSCPKSYRQCSFSEREVTKKGLRVVWFRHYLLSRSRKEVMFPNQDPKSDNMTHIFTRVSALGSLFWVWNGTIILLGRRLRVAPGERTHRMSKKLDPLRHSYAQRTAAASRRAAGHMGCLTPPSYLTKRTAHLARPCQRQASAKVGKTMRPYAAEGWQGAAQHH